MEIGESGKTLYGDETTGCLLKVVSKTSLVKLINRPIEKLCPLEIRAEQFEDNKSIDRKEKQLLEGF